MASTIPVEISVGTESLPGDMCVPPSSHGVVLFAHGSGSSRLSLRNQFVARALEGRTLATLLIDLLTRREAATDERTAEYRFNIPMLAERLVAIVDWLREQKETARLSIGLFGASTGGGAALMAAAERPAAIGAVVSRGGRPDLAGPALHDVAAPTLLIVGGRDDAVIRLNRDAMEHMRAPVMLKTVPGATHLFEENGALERVAGLAGEWFSEYLHPVAWPARH